MNEIEEIRAEIQEAIDFTRKLTKADPAATLRRVEILRAVARAARGNTAARAYIERLLEAPAKHFPEHAATFRATYLDGETRPSPRQLARRFHIDLSTVTKRNRHIFEAMLPAAFGVYGVFFTDGELECHAEDAGDPREAARSVGER